MNYRYVAYTDSDKKLVKGTVNGVSEAAAAELLLTQGYQPITVQRATDIPPIEDIFPSLFKVKNSDIVMFSRQMATLLDAGISIVPALQLILEQTSNRAFKKIIAKILDDLRSGSPFSEALTRHREIFGELYCELVAVGERTGAAADSLRQAASHMEKDIVLKKKIKKALTYPIIVLSVAVIVIGVLVVFVLPKMTAMLVSMDVPLPATTRALIAFTDFTRGNMLLLMAVIGLVICAIVLYIRKPSGRRNLDRFLLSAPVVGKTNLMNEMARFSRTLGILIRAGLPLPDILDLSRKTSSNTEVKNALSDVRDGLLRGEGLSEPMSRNEVFPRLLVQMVMVGEESGKLESTLDTVAASYEAEADDRINTMVAMIEPIMTIVLAVIIGFIALSVITPMYSMTSKFK